MLSDHILYNDTVTKPGIIAEIGCNHMGSLPRALRMIQALGKAISGRIDCAVKFQMYDVQRLYSPACTFDRNRLKPFQFTDSEWLEIINTCNDAGLEFLCTPFDVQAVEFLTDYVDAWKIGSGDVTDVDLLRAIAATGKPIIMSTGMRSLCASDIDQALQIIGRKKVLLMACTSAYPTPAAAADLSAIQALRKQYRLPVGYSCHTPDPSVPFAAWLGGHAQIVEVHVHDGAECIDQNVSLDLWQVQALADRILETLPFFQDAGEAAREAEMKTYQKSRKYAVALRTKEVGTTITRDDFALMRCEPKYAHGVIWGYTGHDLKKIIGARVTKRIQRGDVLYSNISTTYYED